MPPPSPPRRNGGEVVLARDAATAVARSFIEQRGLDVSASVDASDDGVRVLLRGAIDTTFLGLVGIEELPVSAVAEGIPVTGAP